MSLFPHLSPHDAVGLEAMQAAPYAMKRIAAMAGAAFDRALKGLRPDIVGATLRAMFS